eukprot:2039851-Ditylum_brightwellii.AAC.1
MEKQVPCIVQEVLSQLDPQQQVAGVKHSPMFTSSPSNQYQMPYQPMIHHQPMMISQNQGSQPYFYSNNNICSTVVTQMVGRVTLSARHLMKRKKKSF